MNTPQDYESRIKELIEVMGDICHESYTGCTATPEPHDWDYSYKNEVINLLADPRITERLTNIMEEIERNGRIDELERLTDPELLWIEPVSKSKNIALERVLNRTNLLKEQE